jgi:putative protein-disulfide isomerase
MKLYFILDPMCSWCWGFRSAFEQLRLALSERIHIQYVMGGLAPDSDEPMPEKTREYVQSQWKLVTNNTGAEFNWDFWQRCQPRRSTYPACRAVIASGLQNEDARADMIYAIQRAYYVNAKNPSDLDTLIECATEIGLDTERFTRDMQSAQIDQLLMDELQLRSRLGVTSFPSLRLEINGTLHDIGIDYMNPATMLQQINELVIADG